MALTDKLKAIADAIRGKTGNTASITLDEMVTDINNLPVLSSMNGIVVNEYWSADDEDLPRDDAVGFVKKASVVGEHYKDNLFVGMFAYYSSSADGSSRLYYYSPFAYITDVELPSTITSIPAAMFIGQSRITYNIPDSVVSIGAHAFHSCWSASNIPTISLPSALKYIKEYAFYETYLPSTLNLPENLETIEDYAFAAYKTTGTRPNKYLYHVVFPQTSLKTIGSHAFYSRMNLREAIIPDSVTFLGEYAFYYCTSLTTIKLGKGISSIPKYCFYYIGLYGSGEISIEIPDNIVSIGDYAFYYAYLTEFTVPESILSIGKYCFYQNYKMTDFICKHVVFMDKYVLAYCSGLTNVVLGGYGKPYTVNDFYTADAYQAFYKVTQTTLVITIYTEGGVALNGAPWGATGATIIYKDSTVEEEAA